MTRFGWLAVVVALTGLGCAADTGGPTRMDPVAPTDPPATPPAPSVDPDAPLVGLLEIVGEPNRVVDAGTELTIDVRYTVDGTPQGLQPIDFAITGEPAGASLSGRTVMTDTSGIARIVLRTGMEARFEVEATRPDVSMAAVMNVTVARLRFGTLDTRAVYAGSRDVRTAEFALFTNTTCAAVRTSAPTPAAQRSVISLSTAARFESVEIGIPLAVYALGIDARDTVAADGCIDTTLAGPMGTADAQIGDIPELMGGEYALTTRFDVTEGVPPALDAVLEGFTGLSTDPAAYIVGLVADAEGAPDWLRDALGVSFVRSAVTSILRGAIDDVHVPEELDMLLDTGADLDAALSQTQLNSLMTMAEPGEFTTMSSTHQLREIAVPLDGAIVTRPVSVPAVMFDAGFDAATPGMLVFPEHNFALSFGQLVTLILNEVLLPRLPGAPHSIGELAFRVFPCADIAEAIASEPGTTRDVVNGVCQVGVALLGGWLDSQVQTLFDYDTLVYAGRGPLQDMDYDYARETIGAGTATGSWTGADGTLSFPGTLSGSKNGAMRRVHPVRERIRALR
ncbi:MAG: hypothetical protein IT379_33835 [Deltaproteobacteria bacterium]|nr:hypothetical protein [Deltaproteobacteria bacterium]